MTIDGPLQHITPAVYSPGSMSVPPVAPATVPPQPATGEAAQPPGVNPELWSVLSADEQSYFADSTVRGPLTYGPNATSRIDPGTYRGQRIDVSA